MTTDEMDRELKRAWKMLLHKTAGDEDLSTDALTWVWTGLQDPGQVLCWRLVKRALYKAKRLPFWGTGAGHKARSDALRVARPISSYSTTCRRTRTPQREAEIREALGLVQRMAQTPLQRQMVKARLLGALHAENPAASNPRRYHDHSPWRWFTSRCRRAYPSLIGIA